MPYCSDDDDKKLLDKAAKQAREQAGFDEGVDDSDCYADLEDNGGRDGVGISYSHEHGTSLLPLDKVPHAEPQRLKQAHRRKEKKEEAKKVRMEEEDNDSDSSLEAVRLKKLEEEKAAMERLVTEKELGEAEDYLRQLMGDPNTSLGIKQTIDKMLNGARYDIAIRAAQSAGVDQSVEEALALDPTEVLSDEIHMAIDEGTERVGWTDLSYHKKVYKEHVETIPLSGGAAMYAMLMLTVLMVG